MLTGRLLEVCLVVALREQLPDRIPLDAEAGMGEQGRSFPHEVAVDLPRRLVELGPGHEQRVRLLAVLRTVADAVSNELRHPAQVLEAGHRLDGVCAQRCRSLVPVVERLEL